MGTLILKFSARSTISVSLLETYVHMYVQYLCEAFMAFFMTFWVKFKCREVFNNVTKKDVHIRLSQCCSELSHFVFRTL